MFLLSEAVQQLLQLKHKERRIFPDTDTTDGQIPGYMDVPSEEAGSPLASATSANYADTACAAPSLDTSTG